MFGIVTKYALLVSACKFDKCIPQQTWLWNDKAIEAISSIFICECDNVSLMLIYLSYVVGTVNNSTVDVYPQSYTVEFNDVGKKSSTSTPLTINIVDDPLVETRESFVCIAFQPRDVPGVRLENPRTLEITVVDNDSQCWIYNLTLSHAQ